MGSRVIGTARDIPALVPNGAVRFELGLVGSGPCHLSEINVGYATVPSSAAGTIVLEIRKVAPGESGLGTVIATVDLETLVADTPKAISVEAVGALPALTRLVGNLVSDNADAVDGTLGFVSPMGRVCGI